MVRRHFAALAVTAALLCLLVAAVWRPAGAAAQIRPPAPFQAKAGPYQITLEQRLSRLSLGAAGFVVTVQELPSGRPVPDARVALWLQSPRSTDRTQSLALGGPDAPGQYVAELNLDAPGLWQVAVEVSSPLGVGVVEAPPVAVPAKRQFSSGSWVFIGVTLALVAGAGYVFWSARRVRRSAIGSADSYGQGGG
jgi:protein-S-isoprenylcysteine O-methyltransferase Ste14